MLKCPNPSCPYAFDPSQVPTGVVLSCPRCSMQFTLGAPTAAPSGSTAQPPSRPPAPMTDPDFEAVGRTAVRDRDEGAPVPGRRTGRYQIVILAGVAAVLMAGTALAIIFKVMNRNSRDHNRAGAALTDNDRNIGLAALPPGWAQDDATKQKIGSPYLYGFKRENPEAYVAIGAAEYAKWRSPRSSEMRRDLLKPMGKLFHLDPKVGEEPGLETNWLGQVIGKRHGFKFRERSGDGLIWQGEAYTVATKGMAYYWVSWCGEGDFDGMKDEFAKFRGKFKLLGTRDDWREKVPQAVPYKGATINYAFTDAEDIWKDELVEAEKMLNPDLDRLLRINHTPRGDRQGIADKADLRVYLLDGGGDPLERAREYVRSYWVERLKMLNETFPAPTFTELTDEPQGDELPKGSAPFVRWECKVIDPMTKRVISSTESRLIVVSAARVDQKIVVLHCWCELDKREVFESRFIQIASSLR